MKMELAEGRSFDVKMSTDSLNYIVNEEAIKQMGIENPIGKSLRFWRDEPGTIIGVVKNFHHQSLHSPIEPIIIRLDPNQTWNVFAKLDNNHLSKTLGEIEELYKKYEPAYPFQYTFMDDKFKQMYSKELLVGTLSNYAAGLAIFISCLGLFGLTVYTTSQRTKEIGIRKVMGASIPRLVLMLTSKFTVLILLSLLIAFPASYFIMDNWMEDFTFRAGISLEKFLIAGGLALTIAWLTIGYQAIKVSVRNPIDALKYE
ncbi:FtsX-like permease family protein [Flammeovirgaceae bacterium SG7u.111]|nr:FtsX-like permease family protein [Flammeovirgaceae bacterium SG7u.132]WPO34016.1 FtsX-like permease family protein [Flammeovirgaceae bacterium SG7u.111]